MDLLSVIACWQFVVIALATYVATFVARTVIGYFKPNFESLKIWRDLILPLTPVLFGCVLCGAAPSLMPTAISALAARCIYGCVPGFFSSTIYRAVKASASAFIAQKQFQATVVPNQEHPTDPTEPSA